MSVRVGDRTPGKISAVDASKNLISYTYDRVHDKTLPKSDRWLMAKTIWDDASMARAKLLRANAIRVECRDDAETRLLLLKESIGHLDSLCASIDNAKRGDTFYQVKRMKAFYNRKARDLNGNESGKTSQD